MDTKNPNDTTVKVKAKVDVGSTTIGAIIVTLLGAVGAIVAAIEEKDTLSAIAGVGVFLTVLSSLGGRYAQAVQAIKKAAQDVGPTLDEINQLFGIGREAVGALAALPLGDDPDPIDSAEDEIKEDDPMLLALLEPSDPAGEGYVYGDGEQPSVPDVDLAKTGVDMNPIVAGEPGDDDDIATFAALHDYEKGA